MHSHCFPMKVQKNTISCLPTDAQSKGGVTTGQELGGTEYLHRHEKHTLLDPKAHPRQLQIMPRMSTFQKGGNEGQGKF